MNKFWTIPILTVYLYAITILAEFGYNSFFNIPSNLVESSLAGNAIYAYVLAHSLVYALATIPWWDWIVWILATGITIIGGYLFLARPLGFLSFLILIPAVAFLIGSVSFGEYVAKHRSSFPVLANTCVSAPIGQTLVVVNFYNGQAIVVPIDAKNKMIGGFFIQDISGADCITRYQSIGMITE